MSYETRFPNCKEMVEEASKSTLSASAAAAKLGIKYDTYKKYAIEYGCFVKNPSGKGTKKTTPSSKKIPIDQILLGNYPEYQSSKLRPRLIEEKIFEHKCYSCGFSEWLGGAIPLELEHKNGISNDHRLDNLTLLCPNCHALTDTYRGKNTKLARMVKR